MSAVRTPPNEIGGLALRSAVAMSSPVEANRGLNMVIFPEPSKDTATCFSLRRIRGKIILPLAYYNVERPIEAPIETPRWESSALASIAGCPRDLAFD